MRISATLIVIKPLCDALHLTRRPYATHFYAALSRCRLVRAIDGREVALSPIPAKGKGSVRVSEKNTY